MAVLLDSEGRPLVGRMLLKSISPMMREYMKRIKASGAEGYRCGITNSTMTALENRLLVTGEGSGFRAYYTFTDLGRAVADALKI